MLEFPLPTGVNMALSDIAIKSSKRHEGKQKFMAFGVYPDVSLAQPRDKADFILHDQASAIRLPCQTLSAGFVKPLDIPIPCG